MIAAFRSVDRSPIHLGKDVTAGESYAFQAFITLMAYEKHSTVAELLA